jgi:hypothetical protein
MGIAFERRANTQILYVLAQGKKENALQVALRLIPVQRENKGVRALLARRLQVSYFVCLVCVCLCVLMQASLREGCKKDCLCICVSLCVCVCVCVCRMWAGCKIRGLTLHGHYVHVHVLYAMCFAFYAQCLSKRRH